MLSLRTPITAEEIYKVTELAPGHPVYQLDGWGDGHRIDSIVLKLESGNARDVQYAAMMMNIVDRNSTQVVLTPQEMQELKTWAGGGAVPDVDTFRVAQKLATALGQPGSWMKMGLKQLKTLDDAVGKRLDPNNPDKADVRVIAKALKDSGGLEKLGEIIAADLFNGSNDRFAYPPLAGAGQAGKYPGILLRSVQNVGNVFVACNGNGSGRPVGLDNYDPFGETRHVEGVSAQQMDLSDQTWGGHLFLKRNNVLREDFAGAVISDLEALLGPRNRKNPFGSQNRLGTARKKRILNGIDSGAKKIHDVFDAARRNANGRQLPVGITRKLAALGW
jgi:hypothetical protein